MLAKSVFSLVLLLCCKVAFSQSNSTGAKTTSHVLLEQLLSEKDLNNHLVRLETVVFPPSYSSKEHHHPCPLFVYVLEGELLSIFDGVKKVYKTGDTFYERASGQHTVTRNNSDKTIAKILVIYLMTPGTETFLPNEH